MSGQVVIVIAFEAMHMAGFGLAAQGGSLTVKELVEASVNKAKDEIKQYQNNIAKWAKYQKKQSDEMAEMRGVYAQLSEAIKKLAEAELNVSAAATGEAGPSNGPSQKAKGYVTEKLRKEEQEKVQALMAEIASLLEEMPEPFRKYADSPYLRLVERHKQLDKKLQSKTGLSMEEAVSFRETLLRTLESYMSSLSYKEKNRDELFERVEGIYQELMAYVQLSQNKENHKELESLKNNILKLIGSRFIDIASLDVLEKKFKEVKASVEKELEVGARRKVLSEALAFHLNEMGYESLAEFPEDMMQAQMQASFKIPGGERLTVNIQRNDKIAFEVAHVSGRPEALLSSRELAHFRKQEDKWCQDIPELVHRLTKQGFSCNLNMERDVPEESIPVVALESADEILADEQERASFQNEPEKRKLT